VDVSALQGSPEAKARLNALLNELEQRALRTFRISPRSGP
jgi:hypothetical protein